MYVLSLVVNKYSSAALSTALYLLNPCVISTGQYIKIRQLYLSLCKKQPINIYKLMVF